MEEEKTKLYQLILKQLLKDGYTRAAELLSDTALLPFERRVIINDEPDLEAIVHHHYQTYVPNQQKGTMSSFLNELVVGTTLDLSASAQTRARTPAPQPRFTMRHASAACSGAFNWDGSMFASGSVDGEVKVVDATLALRENNDDGLGAASSMQLKTLLDHTDAITGLAFHPRARVLLSCSRDKSIRFFAYSSMSTRAFESIADSHPVRAIALHPSGDFILAGCRHPVLRLYLTEQPRAAPLVANVADHHTDSVNHVAWSVDGAIYTSASQDGSVKIWDAVSSRPIRTIANAHDGARVYTAALSRNGAYLLSSGADSSIRVFDVRMGTLLRRFKGLVSATKRLRATFWGPAEEYVLCGTEDSPAVMMWDVATSSFLGRLPLQAGGAGYHTAPVLQCVANPVAGVGGSHPLSFVSCSADHCVKFWSE